MAMLSEGSSVKALRTGGRFYLVLALLVSILLPIGGFAADNQQLHLVSETLVGQFYWQEPDGCVSYRVDILAHHYRTDGPIPVGVVPIPPDEVVLTVGFSVVDPCHSVALDYAGGVTNFVFQLHGSLRSGGIVATVPLRSLAGEAILATFNLDWTATASKTKSMDKIQVQDDGFRYSSIEKLFSQSATVDGIVSFTTSSPESYLGNGIELRLSDAGVNDAGVGRLSDVWHGISTAGSK
jgi:hypothetical protein